METTNRLLKKEIVSSIENKINNANSIIVWKYHELNSNDMAKFRIRVFENHDQNIILKNRLAQIAFNNVGKHEIVDQLVGPNAFLFLNSESDDSLKILNKVIKTNEALEFVAAYIDGHFYDSAKLLEIASLPPKSELLSMLLSVLQAPMRNLAYLISQIQPK